MSSYLVPLLSAAIGALIGVLSNFLTSSLRQKQDITLRLLDQYLEVRREIVNTISELSDRDLSASLDDNYRKEHRDAIARLFYKHYDFLPKPVLDALILLHVCVERSEGALYCLREGTVVAMEESEVIDFIESAAAFENSKYVAALALSSSNIRIRANQAVTLHARHVLQSLNKYISIRDLVEMTENLKKRRI